MGELNGDQLKQTTLDINHRVSVRYTIDDAEEALRILTLTHGSSKESAQGRKELMRIFKINRDDLDN